MSGEKHLETEIKRQIDQAAKDTQQSYRDGVKSYQDNINAAKQFFSTVNKFMVKQAAKAEERKNDPKEDQKSEDKP